MYYIIRNICILFFCMIGSGFTNDTKIMGGRRAKSGDFPYQVSLQYTEKNRSEDYFHFCGGTLVHLNYVLTAAVCANVAKGLEAAEEPARKEVNVLAGKTDLLAYGERRKVKYYIIHENYKSPSNNYDIAILQLVYDFVLSATIKPIALSDGVPENGLGCIVSGWGETGNGHPSTHLLYTKVPIINKKVCNVVYLDLNIDEMICAGYEGRGFCWGDVGGPLVCGNKLCGVASAVSMDCRHSMLGVYTNVYQLKNWIEENGSGTLIINNVYLISMLIVSMSFKLLFKK